MEKCLKKAALEAVFNLEKAGKKELSDSQMIPDPAGSKGLCDQVDLVFLPHVSTIPVGAVTPREVNVKMAKPEAKPEVEDSKLVVISKLQEPVDESIGTAVKLMSIQLGHIWKPEPETSTEAYKLVLMKLQTELRKSMTKSSFTKFPSRESLKNSGIIFL